MMNLNNTVSPNVAERRSTRLTARPAMLADALDDDMRVDSEYEQNLAESSSRGNLKKRKAREDKVSSQVKKFRGKRGLLKQLVEMPLDVLFEIFGHLKPLDLLHLARTTKDLRAILMNRSSISIWKHARSQFDDLPDCPDDLSEPQYAEILFGKACTFCHRSLPSNIVIWTSRVRSCARCLSEKFPPQIYMATYPRHLLDSISVKTWVKSKRRLRERMVYPHDLHERWEEEYGALQTAQQRIDWVTQKVEERKTINAHAKLCEKWIDSMKQAQEMEKTALIDNRKAIIMERVTALGWADEFSKMDFPDRLREDPFIRKICQKDITGRVLDQVDDFISTFMEAVQLKRLQKERDTLLAERLPILRKIYNTCAETYPVNSIIPRASDVFLDPVVQDLFFRSPLSTTFTDKDLETVGAFFPDIVLRWRNKTEKKLLDMMTPSQNFNESLLQLATTIFSCRLCPNEPLTYPRVLIHRCATVCYPATSAFDEDQMVIYRFLNCSYWNASNFLVFDAQKIVCLSEAIKLCGLDPKSTTRENMDKLNPIFECLPCNHTRKGRCTLSWLGLYVHLRQRHPQEGWADLKIELLGDEEAAKVRDRNAETLSYRRAQSFYDGLYCVHCKVTGDSVTLAKHVNVAHNIPEATDKDIVPGLDHAGLSSEDYWLWPPRPVY